MKRREILNVAGASLILAALPVRAAPPESPPLIAWVTMVNAKTAESYLAAFRQGLRQRGYIEGRHIRLETYAAEFSQERLDAIVLEVIARKPAVIVAQGRAFRRLARETKTIPLVGGFSGDMIEAGMVASLARPGGNVTGIQFQSLALVGKRMELLKEMLPKLKRVALISDPGHAGENGERLASRTATDSLGLRMDHYPVRNPAELMEALEAARADGAEALVLFPDAITFGPRQRVADFAIEHRLPTVSGWDAYADAGFLLMYGPSLGAAWSRISYFVDRILNGTPPADLPVEMPPIIETIVNLRTSRALGIQVPSSILMRANRVIE